MNPADRPTTEPRTEAGQIIGCNHIAWGSVAECPYCGIVNDMVPKAVHREEVAEALATDRAGAAQGAAPRAEGLERDRILEALRDEQQYAGALSDALLRLGHHPFGHHESPTSYDADSPRACSFTQCLARLCRPSDERVPESEEPR